MARFCEDKTFAVCGNNGVTALVLIEDLENAYTKVDQIKLLTGEFISSVPADIFTFVALKGDADVRPWFSGTTAFLTDVLRPYIEQNGGRIVHKSFYVPFSNGLEKGIHGLEKKVDELRYIMTPCREKLIFGKTFAEIAKRASQ